MKKLVWFIPWFLAIPAMADIFAASGEPNLDAKKDIYCGAWAANAVAGGANAMRGVPRKLIPIARGNLERIIEHSKLHSGEGIFVFDDDYAEGKEFMEESTFYGYDWVMSHEPAEKGYPQSAEEAWKLFYGECMSRDNV